jgi:NDMA-dependent alcohol dehydrogenase
MPQASVLMGVGQPMELRDVELESPRAGEVKVELAASGVCHSDLSVQNGTILLPTPSVLGHEGAGVITEVGEGVTNLAPGDHVVLSFVPQCGECFYCSRGQGQLCENSNAALASGGLLDGTTRFTMDGSPLFQMSACGTFSTETVAPAIGAVKIDPDMPLKQASLIGCGVLTGVGAALNTAQIREGDTVAVVGAGGVGLNVIQGAKLAGATRIIAVDMVPSKLELAQKFGATEAVNAGETNAVAAVMDLTQQRGADVAFEVIGLKPTIEQTINMTRRGGQAVLVGVPSMDVMLEIPAFLGLVLQEKSIKGCWYGSSNVHSDIPKLVSLYQEGKLMLDELISREITNAEVQEAFEAMEKGEVARSVIVY